ncbi:hypothetical protein ANO14919_094930 [Xylariales sp. No.14919]|nr:SUR7/PalI family-domain-containing protein [Xylaria grammica]GAW19999.1 hypothetical protein ANO14919_094930 [Xylariales sp. No.14919]
MVTRKLAGLNWGIAIFLSLASLLFTLITLLSGVGGPTTASYLTVDATNLAITAKLSTSAFLQDLSAISGSDLVGQSRTRQNLGLSTTYSVSLLTACGLNDDESTTCSTPRVGFAFNPDTDLKLGRTSAQGTLPKAYYDQLSTYTVISTFVAVVYVLTSLLTVLSCIAIVLARRFERAMLISRIISGIVAILAIAATIASIVTFVKLRDTFNSALGDIGVRTATNSGAFGLSAAASVVSVFTFALTLSIHPTTSRYRLPYHQEKRGVDGGAGAGETELMSREARAANIGVGFLARVPTWKRPGYTQIDANKRPTAHSRDHSPDSDREGLIHPAQDDVHNGVARESSYSQGLRANKRIGQNLDYVPTAYQQNV